MIHRAALLSVLVGATLAGAQTIDPRGVYFHAYSAAAFSGVEWVTMLEQPGDRRYEFSDIRALAPFSGTIADDGATVWDAGAVTGTGAYTDQNSASFQLLFGGAPVLSEIWRAPATSPDFITQLESPQAGRVALAGEFMVTIENLDPRTGAPMSVRQELVTLSVAGQTLRLVESDGDFIQGVFEDDASVGFRVVTPLAVRPEYRSFVGSETNRPLNVLADLRFTSDDAFEATVLLQTRTSPGAQTQFVERYSAVRVPSPGAGGAMLACGALAWARRRRGCQRPTT